MCAIVVVFRAVITTKRLHEEIDDVLAMPKLEEVAKQAPVKQDIMIDLPALDLPPLVPSKSALTPGTWTSCALS